MIGRRVYPIEDQTYGGLPKMEPGDYGRNAAGEWLCCSPRDRGDWFENFHGNISRHKITEHEDGTITVEPSILITKHDGQWHGYLEHGVWREC